MTKELEEAKARLSSVLRDHERNPQAGTLYLIAADLRTLLSALSRGDGAPEGWVLVPKEPTGGMLRAASRVELSSDEPITDYMDCPGIDEKATWEAVIPGITTGTFFHPSYAISDWIDAMHTAAYLAMIAAAPPVPEGEE